MNTEKGAAMEDAKMAELRSALARGTAQAAESTGQIADELLQCASRLRVEQTQGVFDDLVRTVEDLRQLLLLVQGIDKGLNCLGEDAGPLSVWLASREMLEEMLRNFEHSDWTSVADFMQYELHPLLGEGRAALAGVSERLG